MFEIILKTPVWVFILFVLLLILGYAQSKDRTLSYPRALMMPYSMFLFSLYGVLVSFGWNYTLILWIIGIGMGIYLGMRLGIVHAMVYVPTNQTLIIKGSWFWCVLILLLFFIKYSVGVMLARQFDIIEMVSFRMSISAVYGMLSGLFFARVIIIRHLHIKHRTSEMSK